MIACESYHLPAHVQPHIDLITPTVHFNAIVAPRSFDPLEKRSSPAFKIGAPGHGFSGPKTTGEISTLFTELENCDKQITPICLRALYGLVYEPLAASKNSYAIGEWRTTLIIHN